MKITYSNYIGKNYTECNIDEEVYFVSETKYDSADLQDIIIYDSNEQKNNSRIYLELANADNTEKIIEFCNKYGSVVSRFSSESVFSNNHDFETLNFALGFARGFLNDEDVDKIQEDYIINRHFKYYQLQMKYLVEMYRFLSQKPTNAKSLYLILQQCIGLICNAYFYCMLDLEYNINTCDAEEYDRFLSPFPFVNYIFRLQKNVKSSSYEIFYEEILQKICDDNCNKYKFPYGETLRTVLCKASKLYLKEPDGIKSTAFEAFLVNEKCTLFKIAEHIFNDALSFEIRETRNVANYHLTDSSDSLCKWKFSTLANALFFAFYFDRFDTTIIKQCKNELCRQLFACPVSKAEKKIYCSPRCAHRQANRKYKKKSQEKNGRKDI